MRRPLIAAALVALAAGPGAARDKEVPAATPTGEPVSCISLTQLRNSSVRDDRTIDFRMRNGQIYRNVLDQECPSLAFENRFSYRTTISQICSGDTITVLRDGPAGGMDFFPGPTCALDRFQPVEYVSRRR